MPTPRMPVAAVFGAVAWHHDLVTFADTDLVIAPRAPVGLLGLVRLDVTHVDSVVGFGPTMRAHNEVTVSTVGSPSSARYARAIISDSCDLIDAQ